MEMNSAHEQSNEIPRRHSFTANQISPMNVLVATNNNHKSLSWPMVVQQPHVQNVLIGQPMMPVTQSIPIVSNALTTSFAIHTQTQPNQQQLQYLTPVSVQ